MAAQELVGASGTIDSSHAVAQGALGVETLGQARRRVVGQNGPARHAGTGGRLGIVGAQEQGVLIGQITQNNAGSGGLRGRVHRGARGGMGGGMRGGGRGGRRLHLAHAHGSTGGADGMPGSRVRVLRIDRWTVGRSGAHRAGDRRRGDVSRPGPGVLLMRIGGGNGCVDVVSVHGVGSHDKQAFRFTRRMAGGPGGDAAVSPGCQEPEQRSIGVADLTANKIA